MMSESGEEITLDEDCRKCGREKPDGLSWIEQENGMYFRCHSCGQRMFLGYLEEDNERMVQAKRAHDRAVENRKRYTEEKEREYEQRRQKSIEEFTEAPSYRESLHVLTEPGAVLQASEASTFKFEHQEKEWHN